MKLSSFYRRDIDGLRALAVISVLMFHLDFTLFSGGFVGVDVFFVISGFLITRLIYHEVQNTGQFSFTRFYLRRFMRLLPAAFVTLLATLTAGYFLLPPSEYERLGLVTTAATFSVSNFSFWLESGYFDLESSFKPLLHTWTLSIEEQFYLLWPVSLWILTRKKVNSQILPLAFLLIVSLLSLVAVEVMISKSPHTAFFLLPFRIYEFAIGAALVWLVKKGNFSSIIHEVLVFIGLVMIIVSFFLLDEKYRFPGLLALLPCIGTGLILFSGDKSKISSAILTFRPTVFVGLISYSLYLVHWPLVVFFKKIYGETLSLSGQIQLIIISFLLAVFMYKFIETPFRRSDGILKRFNVKQKFGGVIALAIGISSLSLTIWNRDGLPERFSKLGMSDIIEQVSKTKAQRSEWLTTVDKREASEGAADRILIIGDSYANDIAIALAENYESKTFFRFTQDGCRPFLNYASESWKADKAAACRDYADSIITLLERDNSFSHIVINTRWGHDSLNAYRTTLKTLSNFEKPIIVIGPRNRLTTTGSQLYFNVDTLSEYTVKIEEETRFHLAEGLHTAIIDQGDIQYIDIRDFQCPNSCSNVTDDSSPKLIIYDTAHFTVDGSIYVGSNLKRAYPGLFD